MTDGGLYLPRFVQFLGDRFGDARLRLLRIDVTSLGRDEFSRAQDARHRPFHRRVRVDLSGDGIETDSAPLDHPWLRELLGSGNTSGCEVASSTGQALGYGRNAFA